MVTLHMVCHLKLDTDQGRIEPAESYNQASGIQEKLPRRKPEKKTEVATLFGLRGGSQATHPSQWKGREALLLALTINSPQQGVTWHLACPENDTISSQALGC